MTTTINRLAEIVTDPRFRTLGKRAVKVLLVLLAHSDQEGQAYPGARRLAELSGVPERWIGTSVRELEAAGALKIVRQHSGRATRRVVIAPAASERSIAKLRTRPVEVTDSVGSASVDPTVSVMSESVTSGVPDPTVSAVEVTDSVVVEVTESVSRTPKEPQEPQGEAAPSRFALARDRRDGFAGEGISLLVELLGPPSYRGAALVALRAFAEADGTLIDLKRLALEAQRAGDSPWGLLLVWLRDPPRWRDSLADVNARKKHARSASAARADATEAERAADLNRSHGDGPRRLDEIGDLIGPIFGEPRRAHG